MSSQATVARYWMVSIIIRAHLGSPAPGMRNLSLSYSGQGSPRDSQNSIDTWYCHGLPSKVEVEFLLLKTTGTSDSGLREVKQDLSEKPCA